MFFNFQMVCALLKVHSLNCVAGSRLPISLKCLQVLSYRFDFLFLFGNKSFKLNMQTVFENNFFFVPLNFFLWFRYQPLNFVCFSFCFWFSCKTNVQCCQFIFVLFYSSILSILCHILRVVVVRGLFFCFLLLLLLFLFL